MSLAFKIYVSVLANRLEKEAEENGIMSEKQANFWKKRKVVDNIYVLNYVMGRKLKKDKK